MVKCPDRNEFVVTKNRRTLERHAAGMVKHIISALRGIVPPFACFGSFSPGMDPCQPLARRHSRARKGLNAAKVSVFKLVLILESNDSLWMISGPLQKVVDTQESCSNLCS
jgi:hypothetical protein